MATVIQPSATRLQPADLESMHEHAQDAAQLLKTIGNQVRLMVLCQLVGSEMSVGELNANIGLSQSALSQHLAVLRKNGLVETRRESQTIYYRLASNNKASKVIEVLHEVYCGDQ